MSKKITIGLFNDAFYPAVDGVVSVVDNYARNLSKVANVIVFVPDYKKEYNDSIYPYKVVRVKSVRIPKVEYTFATPKIDMEFYKELHKYDLDIIHVHSPVSLGATAIKYAKKYHIPGESLGTPLIVMGNHYVMGWGEEQQRQFNRYARNFRPQRKIKN